MTARRQRRLVLCWLRYHLAPRDKKHITRFGWGAVYVQHLGVPRG